MSRKEPLYTGQIFHIYNRSVGGEILFNNQYEYLRMVESMKFYKQRPKEFRFCDFLRIKQLESYQKPSKISAQIGPQENAVEIIAYCLMSNHVHFVLKQLEDGGISRFMGNVQNSYARYFNTKYERRGHLWQSTFKNTLVESDEQLLQLTKYVHLNPVKAKMTSDPSDWTFSSYNEFVGKLEASKKMTSFENYIDCSANEYARFVCEETPSQRELAMLNEVVLE